MRVLGICGSLQARSGNLALLHAAAALMPEGAELVLFDGLRELPLFNPDIEAGGAPESVTRWRLALAASDAVLIASPEYGFSLPGALKNGIDWVIGSGELERKVVAVTAAVAGPGRTRRASRHPVRGTRHDCQWGTNSQRSALGVPGCGPCADVSRDSLP